MKKKIVIQTMAAATIFATVAAAGTTVSFAATKPANQMLTISANENATYAMYKIAVVNDTIGSGTSATYSFDITDAFKPFFADSANGYKLSSYNEIQTAAGADVATMGLSYDKTTYSTSAEAAKLAAALEQYVAKNTIAAESTVAGAHEAGYYLIVEKATTNNDGHIASKPMLVSLVPNGTNTVTPKDDSITVTDQMINSSGTAVQTITAAVGDTVDYKVTTAVPTYPAGVLAGSVEFKIEDTVATGLTPSEDSVKVSAGGADLTKGTDYTVAVDGQKVTVTLKPEAIIANQGKELVVSGSTTVNSDVKPNTTGGNKGSVTVTYTNNSVAKTTGTTESSGNGIGAVCTYGIKLKTVDASSNTTTGAQFKLTKDGEEDAIGTYTIGSDGTVTISGLGEGSYTLTQVSAASGYAKYTDPIKFTIADKTPSAPTGLGVFKVTSSDSVAAAAFDGLTDNTEDGSGTIKATLVMQSRKGISLPETGSTEARNLMIAGAAAVAVGGVVMVASRKKENE